jgi:hypothetical protein
MQLNRTQRRYFTRKSPEGKRMSKLNFLHPDKIEKRRQNLENGKQVQEDFTRSIQEKLIETLGPIETRLTEELKEKNILKTNIDHYLDVWSGVNFWPRPDDYQALRKELKKLNKEYGVNG